MVELVSDSLQGSVNFNALNFHFDAQHVTHIFYALAISEHAPNTAKSVITIVSSCISVMGLLNPSILNRTEAGAK